LIEQTNRLVVRRQQAYGEALDIPWGISESAYNARDMEFTYQYTNFGVQTGPETRAGRKHRDRALRHRVGGDGGCTRRAAQLCAADGNGRGGWTWYTGASGWMYRAGIEGILGIRREGKYLVIDPCIPPDWPGYEASVKAEGTRYDIRVISPSRRSRGISWAILDGENVRVEQGPMRIALDGAVHDLRLEI
jgi:hypothetical protein